MPLPQAQSPAKPRILVPVLLALVIAMAGGLWLLLREGEPPAPAPIANALPLDQKPGIAVLPFENLGPAPEQDYFADGITEDLTTDLSKLSGLRVLARDSALAYKDSREDARLIDGKRGGNLRAERYDRKIEDIFAIQDETAAQIVAALAVEIAPADRSRRAPSHVADVNAYDELLRGLD